MSRFSGWRSIGVIVLISLVYCALGVTSMIKKSFVRDEPVHLKFGNELIDQGRHAVPNRGVGPVSVLNVMAVRTLGLGHEAPLYRTAARLPTILLGGLTVFLTGLFSRRLFNDQAGVLSAILAAFEPNLIAHGRLVTTDLPISLGVLLFVMSILRLDRVFHTGSFILCGLALTFALLAKANSLILILLLPGILVSILIRRIREGRDRRIYLRFFTGTLALILTIVAGVNAGFLFAGTMSPIRDYDFHSTLFEKHLEKSPFQELPIPFPYVFVTCMDLSFWSNEAGHPTANYLMGRFSPEPFPEYYLMAFLFKSTAAFTLLAGVLGIAALIGLRRMNFALTVIGVTVMALMIVFSLMTTINIGLRYILPVYPLLCVAAGHLVFRKPPVKYFRSLLWVLTGLHALESSAIWPHYLEFFNVLSGGPRNGYRLLSDSNLDWGQDQQLVREYAAGLDEPLIMHPREPVNGLVAVNSNRIITDQFGWLKDYQPIHRIAYTWFIYRIEGKSDLLRENNPDKRIREKQKIRERLIGPGFTDTPRETTPDTGAAPALPIMQNN